MLTIAICDDNHIDIEKTTKLLDEWAFTVYEGEISIQQFASPYMLVDAVANGVVFDVFLLDILMPEMTGISLGERLQGLLTEPLLVYLSYSDDYYSDAFRLYAFQYICKPIYKSNLFPVLNKVVTHLDKRKQDVFVLKTVGGVIQIPSNTIVYAELMAHICNFYLSDGQHVKSLYLRTGFDDFLSPLLQQNAFMKTHTSFVVNLNFAGKLTPKSLTLTTGKVIPIARAYTGEIQQRYMAHGLREGASLV